MGTIKVLTLIGGISHDSLNKKYFEAIGKLALEKFQFIEFDISLLPFYSPGSRHRPAG